MAGSNRTSTQSLELRARLAAAPYRFEFYQALRLLDATNSDLPRIGEATRASQEAIRLGQEPSLAFATSMLASFERGDDEHKDRLDVNFFGMFGPNGPLPLHLTEYARDRDRQERDPTLRRFADIFHHRMLSLLYRAWANSQPAINFDRAEDDAFADFIGSLIGIGVPEARDPDALPDHSRLYLAGLLGMQNRPAVGLAGLLEEYLQVPISVEEFIGEWLVLPEDSRLYLGQSERSGALGVTTTAGARTWYCQGKIRVVCGPLAFRDFRRLLPDRDSLPGLVALVRQYMGDELVWELNPLLTADEVPSMSLGVAGQLGWTSWLGTRTTHKDADDVLLTPMRA